MTDISPEMDTLLTIARHREFLQDAVSSVKRNLEIRAEVHDRSKISKEEFNGFVYINTNLKDVEYGSEKYKEVLRSEGAKPAVKLHQVRNSHHPEYHNNLHEMDFLDLKVNR